MKFRDLLLPGLRFTRGTIINDDLDVLMFAILKKRWRSPQFIVFYVGP